MSLLVYQRGDATSRTGAIQNALFSSERAVAVDNVVDNMDALEDAAAEDMDEQARQAMNVEEAQQAVNLEDAQQAVEFERVPVAPLHTPPASPRPASPRTPEGEGYRTPEDRERVSPGSPPPLPRGYREDGTKKTFTYSFLPTLQVLTLISTWALVIFP